MKLVFKKNYQFFFCINIFGMLIKKIKKKQLAFCSLLRYTLPTRFNSPSIYNSSFPASTLLKNNKMKNYLGNLAKI